jgi:hypothetical protein
VPELIGGSDAVVMPAAGSGAGTAGSEQAVSAVAAPYEGASDDSLGNTAHRGHGAVCDTGEIAGFERE